jgi:hypothetical protein
MFITFQFLILWYLYFFRSCFWMFQLPVTKNLHESFFPCLCSIIMNKLECFGICLYIVLVYTHELSYPDLIQVASFSFTVIYTDCTICIFFLWMAYRFVYETMFLQLVICFIFICKYCGTLPYFGTDDIKKWLL